MPVVAMMVFLATALIAGCGTPGAPTVTVEGKSVPTVFVSSCRQGSCGDALEPPALIKGRGIEPTPVAPGAVLKITNARVSVMWQWTDSRLDGRVTVQPDGTLTLPKEPDVYTYMAEVRSLNASAGYALQVKVTGP